jgi:hypothetical protein
MSENEVVTKVSLAPEIEATGLRRSPRRVRLIGFAVGVILVIGLAALVFWLVTITRGNSAAGDTTQPENSTAPTAFQRDVVSEAGLADTLGVRIVQVAVTGGGGLIDLRYQVIDPDKALAIHDEDTPPALVDDTTGVVVDQLLMGHFHSGQLNAGQTYYLIFENPGNLVQRGTTVSVLLGDEQIDHIAVK